MNKQTISKKLLLRLAAQADEAEIYNNIIASEDLTNVIRHFADTKSVRSDDKKYEYTRDSLEYDIRRFMWLIGMRVFDYYDSLPDVREIESTVEDLTETAISAFSNIVKGVDKGSFEPPTPGEESSVTWDVKPVGDGHEVVIVDDEPANEEDIVKEGE